MPFTIGLLLLVLFRVLLSIEADKNVWDWQHRTWQTNLNFDNPQNWNLGRKPCTADRWVLQNSETLVLELPKQNKSLRELVLPAYIELILPHDGSLRFSGKKKAPGCIGTDAVFKLTEATRWLDPKNWNGWNAATPDLERIPCTYQNVLFPTESTYNIIMPDSLQVGRLNIDGTEMSTNVFASYVAHDGMRQFHTRQVEAPEVEVSGQTCPAGQWCECGNEYLTEEVCSRVCPTPLCRQPVMPAGYCCPTCGAYVLLGGILPNKTQVIQKVDQFLQGKGVVHWSSRVRDKVQVVLVEEGEYSGQMPETAKDLKNFLMNSGLGFHTAELYASGHVWYPTTFGEVFGHFISLMVLAALSMAAIIVFYSHNWSWMHITPQEGRPFVFARFENHPTDGEGEVVVASEMPSTPPLSKAFNNPMYGSTQQEQRNVTMENPVYTELEETSFRDTANSIEEETVLISEK